eukprot:IDg8273t1
MDPVVQLSTLLRDIRGIDEQTLEKLHAVPITTLSHLIRQNPSELQRLCGVPATEVRRALAAIATAVGARRQLDPPEKAWVRTGIDELDNALGGGLLRGGLTEICGRGSIPLSAYALRAAAPAARVHLVVGGGSGRLRTCGARRLFVDGPYKLLECLDALRADSLALRALGAHATLPVLIVVDGVTRSLGLTFGMGAPVRAQARSRVDRVATALRMLATDSRAAVVIITPPKKALLGRAWPHVVNARVILHPICVSLGCYRDYTDDIDADTGGFAQRVCTHVGAYVTRKDGPRSLVELDLVKLGVFGNVRTAHERFLEYMQRTAANFAVDFVSITTDDIILQDVAFSIPIPSSEPFSQLLDGRPSNRPRLELHHPVSIGYARQCAFQELVTSVSAFGAQTVTARPVSVSDVLAISHYEKPSNEAATLRFTGLL